MSWKRVVWREQSNSGKINEYEKTIPDNWVIDNKVYWPNHLQVKRSFTNREDPTSSWLCFDLVKDKITGDKETCDQYGDAVTTTFEDSEDDEKERNKILKSRKNVSSTPLIRKMPSAPKLGNSFDRGAGQLLVDFNASDESGSSQVFGATASSSSITVTGNASPALPALLSLRKDSASKLDEKFPLSSEKFQKKMLKQMAEFSTKQEKIFEKIVKLERLLEQGSSVVRRDEVVVKVVPLKPLSTLEQFSKFETEMDDRKYGLLVKELSKIGGKSVRVQVRDILNRVLDKKIQSLFNLAGTKKRNIVSKRPFSITKLYKAIIEAVQLYSKVSESIIRGHIGMCLKYTPDRVGGSGRDGQEAVAEDPCDTSPKRLRRISSSDEECSGGAVGGE